MGLIIWKILVGIMLIVQAYKDIRSMKVSKCLNNICCSFTVAINVITLDLDNLIYLGLCFALVFMQYLFGAFATGDLKLYIIAVGTLAEDIKGIAIIYTYLRLEIVAMFVFSITILAFIIKEKKLQKRYPYAPSICISFLMTYIL